MDNNNQTTEYEKTYQLNGQEVDSNGKPVQTEKTKEGFNKWFFKCFLLAVAFAIASGFYAFRETDVTEESSANIFAPVGGGANCSNDGPGEFQPIDPRKQSR